MSVKDLYPAIRPSLNLDFANTKTLDPRITFSRASTGTYYDGVTHAKAEENLLLRSQEFDNAVWLGPNKTITANDTTAPDGTVTADKVSVSNTSLVSKQLWQNLSVPSSGVISVYAKAAEYNWLRVQFGGSADYAFFDLTNGVTGTVTAGATASMVNAGGGWYRCVFFDADTSGGVNVSFFPSIADDQSNFVGTVGYGVYLWGAQLEQRSSVTAYTATTTQPITNYIPVLQSAAAGEARFDHDPVTGESKGLLIEEQRTNLVTYSEDFSDSDWTKNDSSIQSNVIISPDGTLTSDKIVENTSTTWHGISQPSASLTSGTTYTATFFVKKAERSIVQILFSASTHGSSAYANFDISNGVLGTVSGGTASITNIGNNWYRISYSSTATSTTTGGALCAIVLSTTSARVQSYTGDGTSGVYIWGAQLEAGAFPTSYIPTSGSTATRAADVASITGADFKKWFNADEGTVYVEATPNIMDYTTALHFADGVGDGDGIQIRTRTSNVIENLIQTNSLGQASVSVSHTVGTPYKVATYYAFNSSNLSSGGVLGTEDTSLVVPFVDRLKIGFRDVYNDRYLNGHIKSIKYYPRRLSDAQLQELTQ